MCIRDRLWTVFKIEEYYIELYGTRGLNKESNVMKTLVKINLKYNSADELVISWYVRTQKIFVRMKLINKKRSLKRYGKKATSCGRKKAKKLHILHYNFQVY